MVTFTPPPSLHLPLRSTLLLLCSGWKPFSSVRQAPVHLAYVERVESSVSPLFAFTQTHFCGKLLLMALDCSTSAMLVPLVSKFTALWRLGMAHRQLKDCSIPLLAVVSVWQTLWGCRKHDVLKEGRSCACVALWHKPHLLSLPDSIFIKSHPFFSLL